MLFQFVSFHVLCLRHKKHQQKLYIYVGLTNDVERRVKEHNDRRNRTTKAYAPFRIIYTKKLDTRIEARKKEKYLKSGIGKEFLKKIALP